MLKKTLSLQTQKGSVVQLYRTSDSGSEGQGLESLRGHEESKTTAHAVVFLFCTGGHEVYFNGRVYKTKKDCHRQAVFAFGIRTEQGSRAKRVIPSEFGRNRDPLNIVDKKTIK